MKIWSSKLQQLIHGTASPSLSYKTRPAQLSKRLYLLVLLHVFCVNKSSSHSICNFLGYKTKRQAAIPLGTHIITCCFSCISYASTSINARQWYQATPVSKKVGHDSRVAFSTFLAAVCRASLIATDFFFVTFISCSMLSKLNTPQPTHIPVTRLFTSVAFVTFHVCSTALVTQTCVTFIIGYIL